jgi:hypothetical protein
MRCTSILLFVLLALSTGVLASDCHNWANSITQKWRSYFLDENDFPAYETWDDINLSRQDLSSFIPNTPLPEPVPEKFKRSAQLTRSLDDMGDTLREVKEEIWSYKIETQDRLEEMRGLVKESLDGSACGVLWRLYEESEAGLMKDRMAATFLEKCKDSLGRQIRGVEYL